MADPGEGARGRRRIAPAAVPERRVRSGVPRGSSPRRPLSWGLHAFPRAEATGGPQARGPRLGVSVGKRVGGAVERNRVKRLVRESFWTLAAELSAPDADYVVVARPEAAELARTRGRGGFDQALAVLMFRPSPIHDEARSAPALARLSARHLPVLGPRCKYHPTCSEYAVQAIPAYGTLRGSVLAVWRLARCNPWSHSGVDYQGAARSSFPRSPAPRP